MKDKLMPYLLLSPFFCLMLIFCAGMINGVLQSLGYLPSFDLNTLTLKYYAEVFANPVMLQSIGYSLWIAAVSSVVASVLGTVLCFLIVSTGKAKSSFASLMKLPILIPPLIVAVFMISIFSQTGIVARVFFQLGLISSPEHFPALLFHPNGIGVILGYLWKEIPFVCYFVMTMMGNITETLEQTAMGLGATRWKSFLYITLPLCKPTILNSFFIIFAFSFGAFELPFLLGATLPKALPVMAHLEYTHPDLLHRPYAMVLNTVMMAICFFVSILYYRGMKEGKYDQ